MSFFTAVPSVQKEKNHTYITNKKPVEITVDIQINKIYGINTIDETYIVDGYLISYWKSPEERILKNMISEKIIYENEVADEKIGSEVWIPAFEFINVVESRHVGNKQIIINKGGTIMYNERFNAVFTNHMNFKMFPFDRQTFAIQLEAFSHSNTDIIFVKSESEQDFFTGQMSEEWDVINKKKYLSSQEYFHLNEDGKPLIFSRFNQELIAKRRIQYYLLQFIFPLFLIISISWSVFWISDLSDQLATNFTLMLTVVAFNCNASNILPKLPYSTFLESLITIGYLSIFISLIIIIIGNHLRKKRESFNYKKLMTHCRYLFPLSFLLLTIIQVLIFLTN